MSSPLDITDQAKLQQLLAARQKGKSRIISESEMSSALRQRVRGQDHVVEDMAKFIRLQWGKEQRKRPIASLLFVGPPATGKTELAKAMAEYLFENEKNMLLFDCSELSSPEAKTRLIGTPTGYVGADSGGQLTRPMFSNPRRLILFDEIEKAFSGIFDLFLSLMGDGRLTEQGSGKAADFTQAIIILTSNAIHEQLGKLREQIDDSDELSNAVKTELREAKIFRPEIISRFDRVYVFQPLPPEVIVEIVAIKIGSIAKEYGLKVQHVAPEIIIEVMSLAEKANDMRELTRIAERMLGEHFMNAKAQGWKTIRATVDSEGKPEIGEAT